MVRYNRLRYFLHYMGTLEMDIFIVFPPGLITVLCDWRCSSTYLTLIIDRPLESFKSPVSGKRKTSGLRSVWILKILRTSGPDLMSSKVLPLPSHSRFPRAWLLYYATGIAQVLISLLSLTGRWKDHKETALCWYLSVLPQPWAGKPIWKERKTNGLGRKTMLNNVRFVVDFSTAKY